MIKFPEKQKVLVCPLNWGLGHASRMIPLIRKLIQHQNRVIIASDGYPLALLREEFPEIPFVIFSSCKIRYAKGRSQAVKMLIQLPRIIAGIIKEHYDLKKIIRKYQVDMVISDNRFGCRNRNIKSIYVTHQVMVKMPAPFIFLEYMVYRLHRWIIEKYDECWIPDFEGKENLSGDLSHKYTLPCNAFFIGPLSRFSGFEAAGSSKKYDLVCILSGPEPQRSLLEKILIKELSNKPARVLIIRGNPGDAAPDDINGISFASHLNTRELGTLVSNATQIVCRSGYSGIMDLVALQKKAILIPTPGQTEQEYLAQYLSGHPLFTVLKQDDIQGQHLIKKPGH